MKAGQADFKQAAPSPSSRERPEQGFTHGPNSHNLRRASRSERAVASEYREPASKHTNISIDTCIYTYTARRRISVDDRRQLVTEAGRTRFQPSLPSETRMGTDGSAGGCEQGMGPATGREGLPAQLRAWAMRSPSTGGKQPHSAAAETNPSPDLEGHETARATALLQKPTFLHLL